VKTASVGVRELKTNLSRYLRKVQNGETVPVTSHGKIVARICPEPSEKRSSPMDLVARGFASWNGRRPKVELPKVGPSVGLVSDLLLEDRD
jgi:prevent-host-death family protein